MTLHLLFFSVLRDITGSERLTWQCDGLLTVADLLVLVYARWPQLEAWDSSLLLAMDETYVKRDSPLHDGAEIALMPPVQGG